MDFTKSDFCFQDPRVQNRGGVYFFPNEEVGITAESICVYKDFYGQISSKGNLKNGVWDGMLTMWATNGEKGNEGNYINGKEEGTHYVWLLGYKVSEINYINGIREGKTISRTRPYWDFHATKQEGNYLNGKKEGKWTYWFEDFIAEEENFKAGLKDGLWTLYDPQFGKVIQGHYKKGDADGSWSWSIPVDGEDKVWQQATFQKGELIGKCENFLEDKNGVTREQINLLLSERFGGNCSIDDARKVIDNYRKSSFRLKY